MSFIPISDPNLIIPLTSTSIAVGFSQRIEGSLLYLQGTLVPIFLRSYHDLAEANGRNVSSSQGFTYRFYENNYLYNVSLKLNNMSLVKIMVHTVWSTKNRIPFLNDAIRDEVIQHIRQYAITRGIFIDHINGEKEHLHALISLTKNQSMAMVMRYLKGESSFWINKNKKSKMKFEWQDDYYAVSIGLNQIETVRAYIRNQLSHHRSMTHEDEIDLMIKEYGLERIGD